MPENQKRMHGASQALKLKKAQSELNVTLDEVRKQNRLRQRAEDASTKLRERIGELEKALSETLGPRTPKKECEGLTPEASQALIASLHDSHKKARGFEARLEQANRLVKCIDFCVQVDSEVPRDLESLKKCEDLKRALHQSEKEKVAADAFSIKTKAEQHRITQQNAKIIFSSTWDHVPCSTLQRLSTSRIALEFILTIKAR
jgi:hypothetical protein